MPPKRGRGRGGAGAAAARADPESQHGVDLPSGSAKADVSNSKLAENFPPFAGDLESGEMVISSPNASPASAPTETPAPTPVRAPVQRLESLANRSGISASRAAPSVSKFKPKGVRRDKDERDRAEREELARLDARAAEERKALIAEGDVGRVVGGSIGVRGDRGRGRGGRVTARGRGGTRGRGGMDSGLPRTASGPFAIAPHAAEKKKAGPPAASSATRRERVPDLTSDTETVARKKTKTTTNASATATTSNAIPTTDIKLEPESLQRPTQMTTALEDVKMNPISIKLEPQEPIYPEDQGEGEVWAQRVDIEHINLVSDDEQDEGARDMSGRNGNGRLESSMIGLRPVRLQRKEHKLRPTIVNTEPAAAPSLDPGLDHDHGMFVEQDEVAEGQRRQRIEYLRDGKRWPGVWRDEDEEPQIKADPGAPPSETMNVGDGEQAHEPVSDSVNLMQMEDIVDAASKSDSSKTVEDVEMEAITQSVDHEEEDDKEDNFSTVREKLTFRQKRRFSPSEDVGELHLQTEEDRAEYLRGKRDLRLMVKELGSIALDTESEFESGADDAEENTDMDHESHFIKNVERISLFQFPPGLPSLQSSIKREEDESDFEMLEVAARPSRPDEPVDLTADETVAIKTEPGKPGVLKVPEMLICDDGYIGRLVVRKSGQVELNWGGTGLILSRGTESDFLSLMVTLNPDVDSIYENHNKKDFSAAAGSTSSKLIATPAWDELVVETISLAEDSDEIYDEE